jgi:putative transposase
MPRSNPDLHHRRSIRLPGYDYTQVGAYVVTICTWERAQLFGEVVDSAMRLNDIGLIVEVCWRAIPDHFPHVLLDRYIVMPNHVHGIILIVGSPLAGAQHAAALQHDRTSTHRRWVMPGSLGAIVRSFKSAATKRINEYRNTAGQPVWQRGYYEHVIRNDKTLDRMRAYIDHNPMRWADDPENASL